MNLRLSLAGTAALMKGHPWIAAQAQLSYRLPPPAGTLLKVQDSQGDFLGWAVSEGPGRFPAFRVLSRERRADFGEAWWQAVVERALTLRRAAGAEKPSRRLLNAEADGVPGLVCDALGPLAFLSCASDGFAPFVPLVEKALVDQTRLRGLWRRFSAGGGLSKGKKKASAQAWGPWHRAPLAPLSPARFEVHEFGAKGPGVALDLDRDAGAEVPPWPAERRSWRDWALGACAGRRVLALGDLAGEAAAAEASGPGRLVKLETGFLAGFKGLEKGWKPDRLLVDVPLKSTERFGRFDAAKHVPAFLGALAAQAEPGAELLISSAHPSLAGAEAWEHVFAKAGASVRLVRALAPGPDCPEAPFFPEGRRRRAFVFSLAPAGT